MKVRIGVGTAGFSFDAARDFFAFAERCEAAGFDSLWQSEGGFTRPTSTTTTRSRRSG